jgi:molybdopterin converting factor small subunit
MSIRVKLFASLAESLGRREAMIDYVDGLTVGAVWTALTAQDALPSGVLIAVNMAYCVAETELSDDDEVAYFPPVTGG